MNSLSVFSFLNELQVICLHTSIAIFSTQLNSFNWCYLKLILQFNINHLFAHSDVVKSHYYLTLILLSTIPPFESSHLVPCITNYSIRQSFVYTQFTSQTVLFDPIKCYLSGWEWTWEQWQWKCTPHFPRLELRHQIVQCQIQDIR